MRRGGFQEGLANLVSELKQSEGEVILFADELHTPIRAGGETNIMKTALVRGELTVLYDNKHDLTTTRDEDIRDFNLKVHEL